MLRILMLISWSVLALNAFGQDAPLWLRSPAISPDGSTIVFSYRGNLYRVAGSGGQAVPLTLDGSYETSPVWSRDGKMLAFASDRHGNFDVFVMPAQGGKATRLTYHSTRDLPTDFSLDNRRVLFSSSRQDHIRSAQFPYFRFSELYSIGVAGGQPKMESTIAMEHASYDPSGSYLLYQDVKGAADPMRKHHTSSVTRDIVVYRKADQSHRRLTQFAGEDRSPVWGQNGTFYYLSEASGSFNVYQSSINDSNTHTALTDFKTHPVRFLSTTNQGLLCFTYRGEIYTMQPGQTAQKVSISMAVDDQGAQDILHARGKARQMAVSPNGKEIAFIFRGEVFAASVKEGTTKRITHTPEQERSVSFSPDGRQLLYTGERKGSWNLYRTSLVRKEEKYFFAATTLKEEALLEQEQDTFQPQFSPDGKEVAYLEDRVMLRVLNLESKQSRTILPEDLAFSYADGDQEYQWSPDGKWFLVTYLPHEHWSGEVGLVSSDGKGQVRNLTQNGFQDFGAQWALKGQAMIWGSNRQGLRTSAQNAGSQGDVYAAFFTQEAYDRFRLSKEELELLKEREEEEEKEKEKKDSDDKKKDGDKDQDDAKEDKDKVKALTFDWEGFRERRVRLTIHSSDLQDAVLTPDGEKLLYLSAFEKGYNLWVTEMRTRETKMLARLNADGGSLAFDKKGKSLFLLADGSISTIDPDSGKRKPVSYSGKMHLDAAAERGYLFDHVVSQVAEKFYDPKLHGVDWALMETEYRRFLPHIANNYDFSDLLSELLGELNASHTGGRYRHRDPNGDRTASLGVFYDWDFAGPGLKIAELLKKSPLDRKDSQIKVGTIIERINNQAVGPNTNLAQIMNGLVGERTLLALFDADTNTRWEEVVEPVSQGSLFQMLYTRWVDSRRNEVEQASNGTLGYVHVRSMSDRSFRTTHEEVFGLQSGKKALIIDTRFNGGGDLVDDLSIFLTGKKYMEFIAPNGKKVGFEPQKRWTKPSIVLMSQGNYSDAHCFPFAYKELGIGKLVGMPVPGTCTFVWWERLQDPSLVYGIPNMGVADVSGRYLENWQLEPDVEVENAPEALVQGQDQQLQRAIEELMRDVANR